MTANWIDARDVGSFVFIAMQATPSQILDNRLSTMLLGDDVVHLERQRVVRSRQTAVLAPVPCELPKLTQQPALHPSVCPRLTGGLYRPPSLRLEDPQRLPDPDVAVQLLFFGGGQFACAVFV